MNQYTGINTENTENAEQADNSVGSVSSVFSPSYDEDGNATLIQTSTGTWAISYNGENRPIRFENAATQTVVECIYDSLGRRFEKKVTVAGTLTLRERYLYRGYLQIAAFDVTESTGSTQLSHALKHVIFWDPTEPVATRPLAINIIDDGIYFPTTDLTKNVCELVDAYGDIAATYDYAPFGAVSAGTPSGTTVPANPLQWSSEVYDSELDLVYYNYRHYSPSLGRFLSRDPIQEKGGRNLYAFVKNSSSMSVDIRGENKPSQENELSWFEVKIRKATRKIDACLELANATLDGKSWALEYWAQKAEKKFLDYAEKHVEEKTEVFLGTSLPRKIIESLRDATNESKESDDFFFFSYSMTAQAYGIKMKSSDSFGNWQDVSIPRVGTKLSSWKQHLEVNLSINMFIPISSDSNVSSGFEGRWDSDSHELYTESKTSWVWSKNERWSVGATISTSCNKFAPAGSLFVRIRY